MKLTKEEALTIIKASVLLGDANEVAKDLSRMALDAEDLLTLLEDEDPEDQRTGCRGTCCKKKEPVGTYGGYCGSDEDEDEDEDEEDEDDEEAEDDFEDEEDLDEEDDEEDDEDEGEDEESSDEDDDGDDDEDADLGYDSTVTRGELIELKTLTARGGYKLEFDTSDDLELYLSVDGLQEHVVGYVRRTGSTIAVCEDPAGEWTTFQVRKFPKQWLDLLHPGDLVRVTA